MKPTRLELLVLLIGAGIIAYHLFTPPLIGLADSSDFERILPRRGLAHVSTEYEKKYFFYFNSKYRIIPPWEGPEWYKTSTSLLITPARWFSITIGHDQFFDIRILAAIHTLIYLFGLWLILVGTRSLRISLRVILSVLLIIIFTDVGYVAYFNSFYSEVTALTFLAVGIGSSLMLIFCTSSNALILLGYFLATSMVVTSKPQYVPLAPAFALFGIYLSKYMRQSWRYWLSGGLAVSLCCLALWYYRQSPKSIVVDSAYIGIFTDLLPNSRSPQKDLAELGLNPDYAVFSGTTPYQSDSPLKTDHQFQSEFFARITSHTLPLFYLTHPDRLYRLCVRGVKHSFSTRVRRLGYYEAHSGKPRYAHPFGIWSVARESVFPRSILFLAFFFATAIGVIVLFIKAASTTSRGIYLLYLLLMFIAVSQFFVAVIVGGGEPDLEKHLFMFNLGFDVCWSLFLLGAVNLLKAFWPALRAMIRVRVTDARRV